MFDLNPAVDHLMLDRDLPDPFDRDAPVRRSHQLDRFPTERGHSAVERGRHALGMRLITLGFALTLDERPRRRSVAR